MPLAVVLRDPKLRRSCIIADALTKALEDKRWRVFSDHQYTATVGAVNLVAGYGWGPQMRAAAAAMPDRVLHVDLGFWNRKPVGQELAGYHKLAMGSRWPQLDGVGRSFSRFLRQGVPIAADRPSGNRVVVCGMSAKAAGTFGLLPEEWELHAIHTLRSIGAQVWYRPKPSWNDARPLEGAKYHDPKLPLGDALGFVDALATYHGNCAVDALAAGLPVYAETGVVHGMSVEHLLMLAGSTCKPEVERRWFLAELGWHQWSVKEIADGSWLKEPAPLASHPVFCGE